MDTPGESPSPLPLTEATYFILLSLASGPRHGYAIMKDVYSLSQGRVALSTGTLYTALKRQLDSGWIMRASERASENASNSAGAPTSTSDAAPEERSGRQRKAYSLTPLGRGILHAEVQRLEGLVNAALSNGTHLRPLKRTP